MFYIYTPFGYVVGIKSVMGQPMAQRTDILDNAKQFHTKELAQKFLDKWVNSGVGLVAGRDTIVEK